MRLPSYIKSALEAQASVYDKWAAEELSAAQYAGHGGYSQCKQRAQRHREDAEAIRRWIKDNDDD